LSGKECVFKKSIKEEGGENMEYKPLPKNPTADGWHEVGNMSAGFDEHKQ